MPIVTAAEPRNLVKPIERDGIPLRVHVFEDYETEIEKRWWLRGQAVEDEVPATLSASVENRRVCRATETKDFDDKMGDANVTYKAVIFNPVPGPPMGERTRLSFRYRLLGTDVLRVQIYSLTNGYHRHLTLTGLKQREWQEATVDMTQARRPDGSGGPLAADERIDDIQFYIDRDADLWIDDIVLYEALPPEPQSSSAGKSVKETTEPFPRRIIFTGWFDTGQQGDGHEWPGRFEIIKHEMPLTWKAARSISDEKTGTARIEVSMRGRRPVSDRTRLRFRYLLTNGGGLNVQLVDRAEEQTWVQRIDMPQSNRWSDGVVDFAFDKGQRAFADEIHIIAPRQATLLVDDVLLYEPGRVKR